MGDPLRAGEPSPYVTQPGHPCVDAVGTDESWKVKRRPRDALAAICSETVSILNSTDTLSRLFRICVLFPLMSVHLLYGGHVLDLAV